MIRLLIVKDEHHLETTLLNNRLRRSPQVNQIKPVSVIEVEIVGGIPMSLSSQRQIIGVCPLQKAVQVDADCTLMEERRALLDVLAFQHKIQILLGS